MRLVMQRGSMLSLRLCAPLQFSESHEPVRTGRSVADKRHRAASLDHLVGDGEQVLRHVDAKRLCSLEVDHQFELGRLHHRHFRGVGAVCTENLIRVDAVMESPKLAE
jgi:hypothetical protein